VRSPAPMVLSSTSASGTYIQRSTHRRASSTAGRSGASRDAGTTRPVARSCSSWRARPGSGACARTSSWSSPRRAGANCRWFASCPASSTAAACRARRRLADLFGVVRDRRASEPRAGLPVVGWRSCASGAARCSSAVRGSTGGVKPSRRAENAEGRRSGDSRALVERPTRVRSASSPTSEPSMAPSSARALCAPDASSPSAASGSQCLAHRAGCSSRGGYQSGYQFEPKRGQLRSARTS